jgi:hypothetical protein
MLRSSFLSSTSLVALLAGCPSGDPPFCGTEGGDGTIEVASDDRSVRFGAITAGANNDCPAPSPPDGLISVTVFAEQVEPAGAAVLTFCLPRPDLLEGDEGGVTVPLLPDTQPAGEADRVHLIDVQADHGDGCRWEGAAGAVPTGTVTFRGLCGDAVEEGPWDLTIDAAVDATETCEGEPDVNVSVTIEGTATVEPIE